MDAKHTPGPWIADGTDVVAMVEQYPSVIADCLNHATAGRLDAAHNATLIAAAPELLAALEIALARLGFANRHIDCSDEVEMAKAAIAKALGHNALYR